jgi:hypothetical protein
MNTSTTLSKKKKKKFRTTPLPDGLYLVDKYDICAGFVVEGGYIIECAPILRRKIWYWQKIAVRIAD